MSVLDGLAALVFVLCLVQLIPGPMRQRFSPVTWALRERRAKRRRLTDVPSHRIVVPPGPDGRPGEMLLGTSLSPYIGVIAADGSRNDCSIQLSRNVSVLQVVCLGPAAQRGDPWQSTFRTMNLTSGRRAARIVGQPQPAIMAGLPAARCDLTIGIRRLTDWKFEYRGWLFAAGILVHPQDDIAEMHARGLAVLSTWQWIEPAVPLPPPEPSALPRG